MPSGVQSVEKIARAKLEVSPYSAFQKVTCEFTDGILTLRGNVSSFFHKQLAQEAVLSLSDTVTVRNELHVEAPQEAAENCCELTVQWPEL